MTTTKDEVKLIGLWMSPFVIRVKIALNLKSVGYEFIEETFGSKSELLLKSNPVYKKIPVLLHHDKPICESMIIVDYIDKVWSSIGPAFLPADPYDRAVARFWAYFVDDKLIPSVRQMNYGKSEAEVQEAAEQLRAGLQPLEEVFEKCSKGKGFFNGDTIGYLDISLGSLLVWMRVAEVVSGVKILDDEKTPLLVGWAERFCSDEAVKETVPETEKFLEFRKRIRAMLEAATPIK